MKNRGYKRIFSLGIVGLLFVLQLSALAEEKKSPFKIGGALRVGWAYGSYGDADNPHRRSEKIGDVDLEIFRLNSDLDYHNIIIVDFNPYKVYNGFSVLRFRFVRGLTSMMSAFVPRNARSPSAPIIWLQRFAEQREKGRIVLRRTLKNRGDIA